MVTPLLTHWIYHSIVLSHGSVSLHCCTGCLHWSQQQECGVPQGAYCPPLLCSAGSCVPMASQPSGGCCWPVIGHQLAVPLSSGPASLHAVCVWGHGGDSHGRGGKNVLGYLERAWWCKWWAPYGGEISRVGSWLIMPLLHHYAECLFSTAPGLSLSQWLSRMGRWVPAPDLHSAELGAQGDELCQLLGSSGQLQPAWDLSGAWCTTGVSVPWLGPMSRAHLQCHPGSSNCEEIPLHHLQRAASILWTLDRRWRPDYLMAFSKFAARALWVYITEPVPLPVCLHEPQWPLLAWSRQELGSATPLAISSGPLWKGGRRIDGASASRVSVSVLLVARCGSVAVTMRPAASRPLMAPQTRRDWGQTGTCRHSAMEAARMLR